MLKWISIPPMATTWTGRALLAQADEVMEAFVSGHILEGNWCVVRISVARRSPT